MKEFAMPGGVIVQCNDENFFSTMEKIHNDMWEKEKNQKCIDCHFVKLFGDSLAGIHVFDGWVNAVNSNFERINADKIGSKFVEFYPCSYARRVNKFCEKGVFVLHPHYKKVYYIYKIVKSDLRFSSQYYGELIYIYEFGKTKKKNVIKKIKTLLKITFKKVKRILEAL